MTDRGDLEALRKSIAAVVGGDVHWGDDEKAEPEKLASGLIQIDTALGGGLAFGRISMFVGEESAGKTLLAMSYMRAAIERGMPAVFLDVERTWTSEWARAVGVDPARVLWVEPSNAEQAFDALHTAIKQEPPGIIVLDSIAALPPAAMLEAEMEKQFIGTQARLVNRGISIASALNKGWCIVLINQIREKVGVMYGSPETLPGGKGQNYYAWQIIRVRRGHAIEEGTGEKKRIIGREVKIRVDKSKQSPMGTTASVPFYFTGDFDVVSGLIDHARALGIITAAGGYYTYGEHRWHGAKAAREAFEDADLLAKLKEDIATAPEMEADAEF